jgi:hypothetical protein
MTISKSIFGTRRFFTGSSISAALLALVLCVGLVPTTAHAQGRFGGRSFGSGFGHGFGWGLGFGVGNALIYSSVNRGYYYQPSVVYTTAAPAQVYYVQQPVPQTIVYNTAPAPVVTAPAPIVQTTAPAAPTVSTSNMLSKIVYDASGKPMGVLLLNNDGSQEFVPLAK